MQAKRGSRVIAVPIHLFWCQMGVGGHSRALAALPLERDQAPIVQEAVCGLGLVWTGCGKSRLHWNSMPGPTSLYMFSLYYSMCSVPIM
jgi:hypothetical protein